MLAKLSIQNFKGIKTCDVDDLRRINLFIGKNDSGKSTILEAAYYLFQELYSPPKLSEIMRRRTDVFTGGSELWFNYETDSPIVISATFDSVRLDWRIVAKQIGAQSVLSSSLFGGRTQITLLGETQYRGSDFTLTLSAGGRQIDNIRESDGFKKELLGYASNMSLIDCTLKLKTREIEGILAQFKRKPALEAKFGGILNDVYGKGNEWEFIPQLENTDERRLTIREGGQSKYFSGFGDGLRCCVGIVGNAMSVKNTALFIEEIESHQHSGSLSKLVKHLVEVVRENDLQVFLSTHSKGVWESLHHGVYLEDIDKEKEEFRCFLVERETKTGKVTVEVTDDVQKITRAIGQP